MPAAKTYRQIYEQAYDHRKRAPLKKKERFPMKYEVPGTTPTTSVSSAEQENKQEEPCVHCGRLTDLMFIEGVKANPGVLIVETEVMCYNCYIDTWMLALKKW